jgi:HAD superfamily hydrolase (TIGR01484 family)
MSEIRLIAVDLDGTLRKDDGTIAPEGAETLRKATEQGIRVVLATGRRLFSTQNFAAEIGITDPLIVCDGAQIFASPTGGLWSEQVIPHDVALNITHLGDVQGWELATVIDSITYVRQRSGQALGELKPGVLYKRPMPKL